MQIDKRMSARSFRKKFSTCGKLLEEGSYNFRSDFVTTAARRRSDGANEVFRTGSVKIRKRGYCFLRDP